jgi:serine/threonine protein kinase
LHQLLRGVKYLHENGVLHRDLKPGNLLLTKTCQLKVSTGNIAFDAYTEDSVCKFQIADFGLARKIPIGSSGFHTSGGRPRSAPAATIYKQLMNEKEPMTDHVVTRWYRAPELMLQPDGFYDRSVDMWSVGCIFAEILGRKALFPGKNFLHQLQLIFDIIGTPSPETTARIKSSQAQRFIKSLGKKPKVPFRNLYPDASDEALDLLEKLLHFDPEQRFTVQDALSHPYMQSIEKKYKCIDPKVCQAYHCFQTLLFI